MDVAAMRNYIERVWNQSALPELVEYVRIPNKSPAFDREWQANGHIEQAVMRFASWAQAQGLDGARVEIQRLEKRTPLLLIDIPGESNDCVLLYGHLDKQPEMTGWRDGLGPWQPVLQNDRLYGRGAADDGYAMFACLTALSCLQAQSIPRARCVVVIEACEESGSSDLPAHLERLGERLGRPSLVIGLDSGCGNYDQLWCTTSLRGLVGGVLKVEILTEGIHSGASGIVPDSFRIIRQLLSRIEDEKTGRLLAAELYPEIPEERLRQASAAAAVLGDSLRAEFPFVAAAEPTNNDVAELILNRDWRPALAVLGADGLPSVGNAGNVLRPMTTLKLSLRIPPKVDPKAATKALRQLLESDPPYGAKVSFTGDWGSAGWNAPPLASWLESSLDQASRDWFGKAPGFMGIGGTIPFMSMLGERFPDAQFLITGVLGPHANAHGPNEFLDLPTARKITGCVAQVIASHFRR
ncbi:MAG TPA: M20 family metallopeptidase [Candidatus Binataceae bacterium]|nr:M20 family metallopeptidase [Candidatus Binataceae bacterium]